MTRLRTTKLPSGEALPVLGQGTWRMGENARARKTEVAALRLGIDLGMTLIDTAEMYADGGAERIVGEAISGRRDDVFVVTKFYPQNATRGRMAALKEGLQRIVTNEVLYNLERRGIEWDLIPWMRRRHRPIIAYSPVEEGLLAHPHPVLTAVAKRHDATPAQIALAWVIREDGVIAIPKAARAAHVRENRGAADLRLSKRDLEELDESFPQPEGKKPLETR